MCTHTWPSEIQRGDLIRFTTVEHWQKAKGKRGRKECRKKGEKREREKVRADSERDDRNRKRKAEWVKRWSEGTEGGEKKEVM